MLLLPPPAKKSPLSSFLHSRKEYLRSKEGKYLIASIVDFCLIVLILTIGIFGEKPSSGMISPLISTFQSFQSLGQTKTTSQSFAFVPDLAQNKFPSIDLTNLAYLSFFDVPLTNDGQINTDSRGYNSFNSDAASQLFDRARSNQTKILLTLTAWETDSIDNLLNDQDAQDRLADQTVQEIKDSSINGVTIDFEYPNGGGSNLQEKFTRFVSLLTHRIHQQVPGAQVAVAVPSSLANNQSLYNIENLSRESDKIFIIASNMIVPETKNGTSTTPVYGYSGQEYFSHISTFLSGLFKKTQSDKLVMERAWYGNGNEYPLYIPSEEAAAEDGQNPQQVNLNNSTVDQLIAGVPDKGKEAARNNIPLIAKALAKEGILDSNVLAYALATVEHETDETFQPLEEIQGRFSARRLGYEGGENYFGRGFIQLTHLRNYKAMGERIGMGDELVKHPELAATPEIAAKILAAFFKDNNVANLASHGRFVSARNPINPDSNGWTVAELAMKYESD